MNKSPKTALSPTFQPPHLPSPIGIPRSSHLSPETNIKIQNQFIYSNLKEYRCKPQNSPVWLVQGAAIYINIAAPCTTEIHTENQHLTLLVKPRVQPRFLHHLLILCFSCNPVIPKNKKSPKHFPFSVKIPIFASVPRAERSNAAKPAQLPNRYRLPNFLLFKSYLPTDYKKTIVFRRKTSKSDEPFKIIWIGKFDFRKQLPIAIKSITAMNQRNVELHICGTGNDDAVNEMKRMAEICGIASKCHWHGNVSHDKILKMMASSDLMFFTSIMEATSTVVLEAITVGLPILCFNTCGFGPIVKDFAGITVELSNPYKSVQDFAHELSLLYQNRAVLNDISTRMLEKRQELTWEAKAKKLVRHYEEILKK